MKNKPSEEWRGPISLDPHSRWQYYEALKSSGLSLKSIVYILDDCDPKKIENDPMWEGLREENNDKCERVIRHINKRARGNAYILEPEALCESTEEAKGRDLTWEETLD